MDQYENEMNAIDNTNNNGNDTESDKNKSTSAIYINCNDDAQKASTTRKFLEHCTCISKQLSLFLLTSIIINNACISTTIMYVKNEINYMVNKMKH